MTVNSDIRDGYVRHSVWLERYKAGLAKRTVEILDATEADLIAQIMARLAMIDQRGYDLGTATTKRLQDMLDGIRQQRKDVYAEINAAASDELKELAVYEAGFKADTIQKAANSVAADIAIVLPARGQLHAAVTAQPFRGRLLKAWFSDLAETEAKRINDAIRIGIVEGQTIDQMVQRVRGTRARGYADGILQMGRREAASVVRTAVSHVSARANDALYQANADVMIGVQFVATLDGRTTAQCRSLDGNVYELGKEPKLPLHFNERSIYVPYLGEADTEGTRASQFGAVPQKTNYEEWLKTQPAAFQDEVLGKSKAKLFRDGGLSLDRFVDENGREYTLDDLRRRDAKAWNKTFNE